MLACVVVRRSKEAIARRRHSYRVPHLCSLRVHAVAAIAPASLLHFHLQRGVASVPPAALHCSASPASPFASASLRLPVPAWVSLAWVSPLCSPSRAACGSAARPCAGRQAAVTKRRRGKDEKRAACKRLGGGVRIRVKATQHWRPLNTTLCAPVSHVCPACLDPTPQTPFPSACHWPQLLCGAKAAVQLTSQTRLSSWYFWPTRWVKVAPQCEHAYFAAFLAVSSWPCTCCMCSAHSLGTETSKGPFACVLCVRVSFVNVRVLCVCVCALCV